MLFAQIFTVLKAKSEVYEGRNKPCRNQCKTCLGPEWAYKIEVMKTL